MERVDHQGKRVSIVAPPTQFLHGQMTTVIAVEPAKDGNV
jgi:hypothetical protein